MLISSISVIITVTDWWMDDWISIVYGIKRTFRSKRIKVKRERYMYVYVCMCMCMYVYVCICVCMYEDIYVVWC